MPVANFNDTAAKFTSYQSVKSGLGLEPIKLHRFTLNYDDAALGVAATSATGIDLDPDDTIPANALILDWGFDVQVAFAGGSISAITADVGDSGNADELIDGADLETTGFSRGSRGVYTRPGEEATAYAPTADVVAVGDDLDQLTAGRVVFYIWYLAPADPLA